MSLRLGVVGYSHDDFDHKRAWKYLTEGMRELVNYFNVSKENIEIVSGYTNYGIPRLSYLIADELNLKTVGFACNKIYEENMDVYPVDKYFIHGNDWGDESKEFLKYINAMLRVGGGTQANKEAETFRRTCNDENRIVEYELERYNIKN